MRGQKSEIGDTRVAANGYHYTRTDLGWRLTHRFLAAQQLGRELAEDERAVFLDGDRRNLSPDNIAVKKKVGQTKAARAAVLEARIAELQAELDEINSTE